MIRKGNGPAMPAEKLAALEKLCAAATPGPWQEEAVRDRSGKEIGYNVSAGEYTDVAHNGEYPYFCIESLDDALFIASSRTAVPALAKFLRGEISRHGFACFGWCKCGSPMKSGTEECINPTRLAAEKALEQLP